MVVVGFFVILSSLWIQVKIDVKINEWFGEFYDMIQKALGAPNAITIDEYWAQFIIFYHFSCNVCRSCSISKFFYITLFIQMENSNG